ncbi:isocitrate lyase/phosphoenolpyruvate mutase family protein [Streptomyces sp. NPDC050504]|uniref:isocitrate lyase/phosphoenolpyruvate mutase family protein n=1 Tax=Streptomyces sp. NPDC050504 TaxID=3365618 RepID=UPI0037A471D1
MSGEFGAFRALHQGRAAADPLVLPGPWDAGSARVFADAGFPALATPSAGVAASLGYEDGLTPADEMFAAVARIVRAVDVPVSADVEGGYGLPPRELVERLLATGAVGCNLEDSEGGVLKDPARHADWLAEVREVAGPDLFINARVDTYLYGDGKSDDAVERAGRYLGAGADGIYPIFVPPEQLPLLREEFPGVPINTAPGDGGMLISELGELGATRITFGPYLQRQAMAAVRGLAEGLRR